MLLVLLRINSCSTWPSDNWLKLLVKKYTFSTTEEGNVKTKAHRLADNRENNLFIIVEISVLSKVILWFIQTLKINHTF